MPILFHCEDHSPFKLNTRSNYWEQPDHSTMISAIIHQISDGRVVVMTGNFWNSLALSFPTRKMAVDFFECFRGLCETAKTLL